MSSDHRIIKKTDDYPTHYRTIWLSDIHLGTKGCQADRLLDFLRCHESDQLYLVGDIVDGWQLKKSWQWNQLHNDVIQKLLRKARKGTHVTYIPGNHDAFARDYIHMHFGGVFVEKDTVHITADGRKILVMHGDEFDGIVRYNKWLSNLGSSAYNFSIQLNRWFNRARKWFGLPYWSLSAYLKSKVKNAVQFVANFEHAVVEEARRRNVSGVICGHIHRAEIRDIDGILYCNDGDWVESCTALVEHYDGKLEIVTWLHDPI
ncbi:MAG TPA: UDP-2,3-diacylglucosamine diphosphatase [Kiritimatiellia bacterium]|nr:UDP-2,3-diacylglucosamine diphosphatase [Kiritimatiellia bacterium]